MGQDGTLLSCTMFYLFFRESGNPRGFPQHLLSADSGLRPPEKSLIPITDSRVRLIHSSCSSTTIHDLSVIISLPATLTHLPAHTDCSSFCYHPPPFFSVPSFVSPFFLMPPIRMVPVPLPILCPLLVSLVFPDFSPFSDPTSFLSRLSKPF